MERRKFTREFKTIADFRKDNGPAIRAACAQFIVLCRRVGLFTQAMAAIDGSKFKAVNARDRNFTKGKLAKRIEQVEASIQRYLQSLDAADRQEGEIAEAKAARLKDRIAAMKEQMQKLEALQVQVHAAPDQQIRYRRESYAFRRLRISPIPANPTPKSTRVGGSGTGAGTLSRKNKSTPASDADPVEPPSSRNSLLTVSCSYGAMKPSVPKPHAPGGGEVPQSPP